MNQFIYKPPPHIKLDIIYVDNDLLVINKPAGLLSVPGKGEDKLDCLITRVQKEYLDALTVHRLDMETSGLTVIARNAQIHKQLSKMFELKKISKSYIAIVDGELDKTEGTIDLPLICDWPNRPKQIVDHDKGKASITHYQVIDYDAHNNNSRIKLMPITGRTHQLRVHMQAIGHAILGDRLYANEEIFLKMSRLCLHSCELKFEHPVNEEIMKFESVIPF